MKQCYILFLTFMFVTALNAQTSLNWGFRIGGPGSDFSGLTHLTTDNILIQGIYPANKVDVDPGPNEIIFTGPRNKNYLLNFYTTDRKYVKTIHFQDTAGLNINFIGIDKNNKMLLSGFHNSSLSIITNNSQSVLGTPNSKKAFIARISTSGVIEWITEFEFTQNFNNGSYLEDKDGNYIFTGTFNGIITHVNTNTKFESAGNSDIYIFKVSANGQFIHGASMGSIAYDYPSSIQFGKDGKLIYTFTSNDAFSLKTTTANVTIPNPYKKDNVIFGTMNVKFEAETYNSIDASLGIEPSSMKIDNEDNLYIVGYFEGTVNFDPKKTSKYEYTSLNNGDAYIVKYTKNGTIQWVNVYPCTSYGGVYVIQYKNNSLYCSGTFEDQLDLDPGMSELLLTESSDGTSFSFKLNTDGALLWHNVYTSRIDFSGINSILFDNKANIYYSGFLYGAIDCDPSPDSLILNTDNTGTDIFLFSLHEKNVSTKTIQSNSDQQKPIISIIGDQLYIRHTETIIDVVVTDIQGHILLNKSKTNNNYLSIPIHTLTSGIYALTIRSGSNDHPAHLHTATFFH